MVLDIKICLPCEAYYRAARQLVVVKADGGDKGPENVYDVYAKIINAQSNPRQTPLAGT
jgi:hypothetical protein